MWIKELGVEKTAIISNLDNQAIEATACFTSSETALAVMRPAINSLSFMPYLIEFTTIDEEISNKDREEILAFLREQGITKVICSGRTAIDCLFPSISKGKMMSKLVVSQAIPTLELPEVSAAVVKSYFTVKSGEDAIEYRQRIDYLHEFKSQVKIKTTKIDGEEQFIKLLEVLTKSEGKLGLDFETNAVEPMSEGFKLTEIGLSFSADINHAYGYHYDVPFEGLSERALKAFGEFLDANYQRIYTYNCTFEIAVAFRLLRKFYKFQDVIVMASVNAERSSLKDLLRKKFGAAIWEADVKEFQAEYKKFVSKVGRNAALQQACLSGDIETLRASGNASILAFLEYAEANFEPSEIVESLRHFPSAWGATPKTILGVYCALDAAYTVVLAHHYQLEYPEVMPSYNFALRQPWMAVKFELNGYMWDENAATALEQELYAEAVPLMRNIIEACKANLSPELAMDWATYGQQKIPFNFVFYTGKTQKEKVMLVDTPEKEIEWLKRFWNPGSNTQASRDFFWNTYMTEELRLGVILNLFLETSDLMGKLPEVMSILPTEDFIKTHSIKEILAFLSAYVKDNKNKTATFIGSMLKTAIEELPNHVGRYASDVVKYHYQIHSRYLGVDSDKPETWTKEFKLLFDLFLLKKLLKVISANINGVQGRGSVHLVDTADKTYGDTIWLRKKPYERLSAEEKRTGSLLANVEFNALAANSGRWSASFHSLPSGSPMRAVMVPRRPNHVLVHADYSALEVTVLARVTGDRNLIQVFLDGKDIHRYAASKIFEKPESEITSEERRFSKACFPAGTKVRMLSGELVDISELSSRVCEWTYGCLPTGEVVPAQIKAWAETKKTKDLVRVNLHDGNSFVCTPDHEIMLKDGTYVEAKDLKPEDNIMPLKAQETHAVLSVEVLSLEAEVPVYDIETTTHNFVVALNETHGIFSHNCSFSILYGKGVESFAFDNTGGDVQKAQAIFDAFFKQFPGIKEFIHRAHAEIDRTNAYVTTLLGNKVPIDVNAGGGAKYRQAQNQIIQSLGSMVAGTSMYQFLEYCEKQGWDCAPYAFTHDAYDDSTSVDTLFEYLEGMEEMLVNNVRKTIGIPVSIDYELAANGRDLCSIDFAPREQGERTVTIKGTDIAIKGLLERLKLSQTYDLGDIEVETSEPVDFGWSELWGVGKALKYEWGKTIQQSKATFKVKYRKN